jgi:hypothetical protein
MYSHKLPLDGQRIISYVSWTPYKWKHGTLRITSYQHCPMVVGRTESRGLLGAHIQTWTNYNYRIYVIYVGHSWYSLALYFLVYLIVSNDSISIDNLQAPGSHGQISTNQFTECLCACGPFMAPTGSCFLLVPTFPCPLSSQELVGRELWHCYWMLRSERCPPSNDEPAGAVNGPHIPHSSVEIIGQAWP